MILLNIIEAKHKAPDSQPGVTGLREPDFRIRHKDGRYKAGAFSFSGAELLSDTRMPENEVAIQSAHKIQKIFKIIYFYA